MKTIVLPLVLSFSLVASSGLAVAELGTGEAESTVITMLDEGRSAGSIIEALVTDGRSLRAATAVAVDAAGTDSKIDLARAGICASSDTAQAEKVGESVLGVVGDDALVSKIRTAIASFATGGCASIRDEERTPPGVYEGGGNISGGTGVSPSN